MNFDTPFRSKVARRVFTLFVLCALVPIVGLALVSFFQVRRQLTDQSHQHLYQAAKGKALAVFERLSFLDTELAILAEELSEGEPGYARWRRTVDSRMRKPRFRALVLQHGERTEILDGKTDRGLELTPKNRARLAEGSALVGAFRNGDARSDIWLARSLPLRSEAPAVLWAIVDQEYLWSVEDLPPMSELSVFDSSGELLYTTLSGAALLESRDLVGSRRFEWSAEGETYAASAFVLPLEFAFGSPAWNVVLSEPEASLLASVTEFMKAFPLVVLLSLWVVLLLSTSQIRRSLGPLERLKEGTEKIAESHFDTEVSVRSGDEFEELADSFNGMARRLGQQFHTLSTMSEIDRAVLSTLKTEQIVEGLLKRVYAILSAERIRLTVFGSDSQKEGVSYLTERHAPERIDRFVLPSLARDRSQALAGYLKGVVFSNGRWGDHEGLEELKMFVHPSLKASFLLPVFLKNELVAVISFGYATAETLTPSEREQAQQLTDRLAVALANARLLEEVDRLNWGSLVALARAIDAKSPWTAGHSERAAQIAVAIGRQMGLEDEELDTVHRGGLLHDIGKIGIPPAILDKKGKLTDEEREVMKEHPTLGANILEPIEAYARFIPVVLQHHEWFDGTGYPEGLAGDAISLYARIYSIADVYDALFADRPYRAGLSKLEVVDYIRTRAGSQFDPEAVAAFEKLVASGDPLLEDRTRHVHTLTRGFAASSVAVRKA